jgi:hypothetical protein
MPRDAIMGAMAKNAKHFGSKSQHSTTTTITLLVMESF